LPFESENHFGDQSGRIFQLRIVNWNLSWDDIENMTTSHCSQIEIEHSGGPPSGQTTESRAQVIGAIVLLAALAVAGVIAAEPPLPPIIDPGPPGGPPSDAVVLFDGKDLSKWRDAKTNVAGWKVENGYVEVTRAGDILTREEFGDVQLHVEWAAPAEVKGKDQGRGNSGVYLLGRYEIQVLDGFENKTYPDGQAAAFYGNAAPLVNVCRRPGEWQAYEIIFHAPKPQADGRVEPGSFTVFHNGVLVQDHVPVKGPSTTAAALKGLATKGPLVLQDHGCPVRYRNIWLRKI